MGNIVSNIIDYFYPLKDLAFHLPNEKTIEIGLKERVDEELNDWTVKQYANNSYLMKIPQERINIKRDEIKKSFLLKKYF